MCPDVTKGSVEMARIAMIKAEGEAFYHVVSRIANKAFLLDNAEKKRVLVNMWYNAGRLARESIADTDRL